MLLQELPSGLRPREKLLALGPKALTDAELLALLLRTGTRGTNVLELAHQLLERFQGLSGLLGTGLDELQSVRGMGGVAKRSQLVSIMELARRAIAEQLKHRQAFESPHAVTQFLQMHLAHHPREVFAVMFLDAQHRLLHFQEMFQGTLSQASVYPREVVKLSLELGAAAVVLAHNHPSGSVEPSRADERLTLSLQSALQLVDVRVLDHIIVAPGQACSLAERGVL
ncbi:MAG: JAB domain-containing protein [Limnohabitans sp.]|nr:JAB domain-containing protein [Limnohabitans sp.]